MAGEVKHKELVLAIAWLRSDEMVSVGDDQQVLQWNMVNNDVHTLMHLPRSITEILKWKLSSHHGLISKTRDFDIKWQNFMLSGAKW